jgi:hypothetical protein
VRPVYAPALVAFVGGANFQLTISSGPANAGIGWFPLAPGEVYRPAYTASRAYVRNVNVSNTYINATVIDNNYNYNAAVDYRHARRPNAITAMPVLAFAQSRSVQRARVPVSQELVRRSQVTTLAAVAPTQRGMVGDAPTTQRRPAQAVIQREVVARSTPPAQLVPTARRVDLLQRNPGRPLERSAIVTNDQSPAVRSVRVVEPQATQHAPISTQRGMGAATGPSPRADRESVQPPSPATRDAAQRPSPATREASQRPSPATRAGNEPAAPMRAPPQTVERQRGGNQGPPVTPSARRPPQQQPQAGGSAAKAEPAQPQSGMARASAAPVETPPQRAQPAPRGRSTATDAAAPSRTPPIAAPAPMTASPPDVAPGGGAQEVPARGRGNANGNDRKNQSSDGSGNEKKDKR